jgi:hypothetical protein
MVKIEITQDILDLLNQIKVQKTENGCEIIKNDLYYISDVLHTSMMSWGQYDNHIKDTEKSFDGRMWEEELESRAWNTYTYITENLNEIISVVMSNTKNGMKPGIYKRKNKELGLWQYESFDSKK